MLSLFLVRVLLNFRADHFQCQSLAPIFRYFYRDGFLNESSRHFFYLRRLAYEGS